MVMVQFDSGETLFANVWIDVFSAIIMLIIYRSYENDFTDTPDIRLMYRINLSVLMIILTDIIMWTMNGRAGQMARILGYADNIAYFILQYIAAFLWFKYASTRIFGRQLSSKVELFCARIPILLLSLCILSSPWTGWCFYLDDLNNYRRGILAIPIFMINLAYPLAVSVAALVQYRKEMFLDRKRELTSIAFFAVPPLLGGAVQILISGVSVVWPCTVLSCLLVLLTKESQAISRDALTGLNNRRNMEKYLKMYGEDEQAGAVAAIVIDINDFKQINDRYGHNAGDEALIRTAYTLRIAFSGTSAFLSRYGGDEFVILIPGSDKRSVEEVICKIEDSFTQFPQIDQFPFRLTVSMGYAISAEKGRDRTVNLLRKADEDMYREKARYHQHEQSTRV